MENLINYIESSFNMANCDINGEPVECMDGVSSRLKEGHYKFFVSQMKKYKGLESKHGLYISLVNKALSIYQKVLNNVITFEITDKKYLADFNLYWAKTNEYRWGVCNLQDEMRGNTPIRAVYIGVINHRTNEPLPESDVYHLLLHEIGHLIGLGHSYNDKDVMVAQGEYRYELSKDDIFILQLLYKMPFEAKYDDYKDYILGQIKLYRNKKETKRMDLYEDLEFLANYKKSTLSSYINNFQVINSYKRYVHIY